MSAYTVLIVEDDKLIRGVLEDNLESSGYQVLLASNGIEGLKVLEGESVDLIISDLEMPEMDGLSFYQQLGHLELSASFVFFTGAPDKIPSETEFFEKPDGLGKLIDYVEKLLPV